MRVPSPGAVIRFLAGVDKLGWHKFHDYGELVSETGLSLTTVKRIVAFLEAAGYVRVRYDPGTYRKLFRMATTTVRFSDGYVTYTFSKELIGWSVDVSLDN